MTDTAKLREALENAVIYDQRDNIKHEPGRARRTSRFVKDVLRKELAQLEAGALIITPDKETVERIADVLRDRRRSLAMQSGYWRVIAMAILDALREAKQDTDTS